MTLFKSWRARIAMFLAVVGPGFITANVDNDAGGIWTYSVAGAQFGAAMGTRLRGEETRALLGALVLAVAGALLWDLLRVPANLFSVGPGL